MRRATRMASRFVVLLLADFFVLVALRIVMGWAARGGAADLPFSTLVERVGPLAPPGSPASVVFWFAILVSLLVTGAYSRHRGLNTPLRLAGACIIAAVITTIPIAAVAGWYIAAAYAATTALFAFLGLFAGRAAAEGFLGRVWPRDRAAADAVLIGPLDAVTSTIARAVTAPGGDYRVVGRLDVPQAPGPNEPRQLAAAAVSIVEKLRAHALIVASPLPDRDLRELIESGLSHGCLVLCQPRSVGMGELRPRLVWHSDQPLLEFATPVLQPAALLTKRITDVFVASLVLILSAPLLVAIAIAIRVDSRGPVIFSQDRAGLAGRRFRMLKFRTMRAGADDQKQALAHLNRSGDVRLFKIPRDPRVTRLGGFLRRWSLDEVPQFWNVLRGDMSLVGPRPFFESDFHTYEDHHFRRLDTKPGITGLWQVGGRSDVVNFEDVVFLDKQYIEQWSFWLDVSIMLRTMPSVISRNGAY